MELQRLIEAVEGGEPDSDKVFDMVPRNLVNKWGYILKAYLGSLDAAKALHESLLPGWDIKFTTCEDGSFEASVSKPMAVNTHDGVSHWMARAWLLAILKAYQVQQNAT